MKRDRVIRIFIAALFLTGAAASLLVDMYIRRGREAFIEMSKEAETQASAMTLASSLSAYDIYKLRFEEVESSVRLLDEDRSGGAAQSAVSKADTRLKYWEAELESLYSEILKRLDREDAEKLAKEQQLWAVKRDEKALRAASTKGSSAEESIEYIDSRTESTRLRAFELLEDNSELLSKYEE